MRILGIDPGSRHTGWAVLESVGGELRLLGEGRVSPRTSQGLEARLATLALEIDELLARWSPQTAAVESPFHGMNARSLIVLAQARGAILARIGAHGVELREYAPAEVKAAVAGSGRAGKQQVALMVFRLLGIDPGDRSDDQTDAIAVALCCARRYRMDALAKRVRGVAGR